jgi:hypothetical protein
LRKQNIKLIKTFHIIKNKIYIIKQYKIEVNMTDTEKQYNDFIDSISDGAKLNWKDFTDGIEFQGFSPRVMLAKLVKMKMSIDEMTQCAIIGINRGNNLKMVQTMTADKRIIVDKLIETYEIKSKVEKNDKKDCVTFTRISNVLVYSVVKNYKEITNHIIMKNDVEIYSENFVLECCLPGFPTLIFDDEYKIFLPFAKLYLYLVAKKLKVNKSDHEIIVQNTRIVNSSMGKNVISATKCNDLLKTIYDKYKETITASSKTISESITKIYRESHVAEANMHAEEQSKLLMLTKAQNSNANNPTNYDESM